MSTKAISSASSFKFDTVDKLTSQEGYHSWKNLIEIYLDTFNCLEIVKGTSRLPPRTTAAGTAATTAAAGTATTTAPIPAPPSVDDDGDVEQITRGVWRRRNKNARFILISCVSKPLARSISHYPTAAEMWTYIEDKYDRKNNFNLNAFLKTLQTFKMEEDGRLQDHFAAFEALWGRFQQRMTGTTGTDTISLEYIARLMSLSDQYKVQLFLSSMPADDKWTQIKDNLTSGNAVTYTDIRSKLLNLPSLQQGPEIFSSRALTAPQRRTNKKNCLPYKEDGGKEHVARPLSQELLDEDLRKAELSPPGNVSKANTLRMEWILDTATSHHISANFSCLRNPTHYIMGIELGDDTTLYSTHKGNVELVVTIAGQEEKVLLLDVLFIPGWKSVSLISWRSIAMKKFCFLSGQDNWMEIGILKTGKTVLRFELKEGLFRLCLSAFAHKASVQFWHSALGHSNPRSSFLPESFEDGEILPKYPTQFFCNACALSNSTTTPYLPTGSISATPHELIHSDVSKPSSTLSLGKNAYDVVFIDDATCYAEVFFLKKKSDVTNKWKAYCQRIFNRTGKYPRSIKTYNTTEYV